MCLVAIRATPTTAPMRFAAKNPSRTYPTPSHPSERPSTSDSRTSPNPRSRGLAKFRAKKTTNHPAAQMTPIEVVVPFARLGRSQQQEGRHQDGQRIDDLLRQDHPLDVDARERQQPGEQDQEGGKIPW